MRRFVGLAALCLGLGALGTGAATSRTVVPAEQRTIPWTAQIPACDDPGVISKIQGRFARREANYWNSSLTIVGVDRIRPTAWRPWGRDFIPRRYCHARALISDGRYRRVDYSVIDGGGIIGATWGVEWCVSGIDRLFYFAPDCKMARP